MMDLKNYIEHVYCLEKSCYMQKALVQGLQVQLRKASKPTFHAIKETSSSKGGDILGGIIAMLFCAVVGGLIGLGICFVVAIVEMIASMVRIFLPLGFIVFLSESGGVDGATAIRVVIGGGIIIGLIVGIFTLIASIQGGAEERKTTLIKNNQAAEANQRIAAISKIRTTNIQTQLKRANAECAQTVSLLEQYYGMGIIYPKYRNLQAVSMLYEYLASGRCSQLEGHEGAYNIYEQELRLGIIISKLDDIIDRLDEIKDSQYALVSAVREGNQTAKRICDAVTRCSEKLDSIDTNTEITRYNSEITAFNSTYMAWFQKYHNVKIVE